MKAREGFTLIEVLVSLVVLSISLTAVYSILQNSLSNIEIAQNKTFVAEKWYERIIREITYPNAVYSDKEEHDGITVNYEFERESTPIPTVMEVTMTVSTNEASTIFVYYVQE